MDVEISFVDLHLGIIIRMFWRTDIFDEKDSFKRS